MLPTTTTVRRRAVLATAALGLAGLLAACGSSSSDSSGSSATTATAAAAAAKAPTVTGAWARTSAAMQSAGAAYLTLENTSDKEDALVKAGVDAGVAKTVEIHETVAADGAMGSGTTAMGGSATTTAMGGSATTAAGGSMGGAMKMQPVDKVVIPAKGSVELKPGGYHIMLLDLAKPLVKGESFDLTLTFASGATSTVKVEVRDQA